MEERDPNTSDHWIRMLIPGGNTGCPLEIISFRVKTEEPNDGASLGVVKGASIQLRSSHEIKV